MKKRKHRQLQIKLHAFDLAYALRRLSPGKARSSLFFVQLGDTGALGDNHESLSCHMLYPDSNPGRRNEKHVASLSNYAIHIQATYGLNLMRHIFFIDLFFFIFLFIYFFFLHTPSLTDHSIFAFSFTLIQVCFLVLVWRYI